MRGGSLSRRRLGKSPNKRRAAIEQDTLSDGGSIVRKRLSTLRTVPGR